MKNISAVIITYNEEKNIEACLKSLLWVSEVVIVDSYSSDKTCEIARSFPNVRIVQSEWLGYSKTKMVGVKTATCDWILWVDADEVISKNMQDEINELQEVDQIASYSFPRRTYLLKKWIRYGGWYPGYCERLFNRKKANIADVDLHEYVEIKPGYLTKSLSGHIEHFSYKTLDSYFEKNIRYAKQASLKLKNKPKFFQIGQIFIHPIYNFIRNYFFKLGFLDGVFGFIVAVGASYYSFMKWTYACFETKK